MTFYLDMEIPYGLFPVLRPETLEGLTPTLGPEGGKVSGPDVMFGCVVSGSYVRLHVIIYL